MGKQYTTTISCLKMSTMLWLLIFSTLLLQVFPIAADFVVTNNKLSRKVGMYFGLGKETEATMKSALGLPAASGALATGQRLKFLVVRKEANKWCGDVIIWYSEDKGIHGRKDPKDEEDTQFAVGDRLKLVTDCSSVKIDEEEGFEALETVLNKVNSKLEKLDKLEKALNHNNDIMEYMCYMECLTHQSSRCYACDYEKFCKTVCNCPNCTD